MFRLNKKSSAVKHRDMTFISDQNSCWHFHNSGFSKQVNRFLSTPTTTLHDRYRSIGKTYLNQEEDLVAMLIFNYVPFETRTRGRPKLRWTDCVEADVKVLRVTNWKTVAKQRLEWKKVIGKAFVIRRSVFKTFVPKPSPNDMRPPSPHFHLSTSNQSFRGSQWQQLWRVQRPLRV
ncbi:hypothetical protein CEXT_187071 [Caerostris extrusa]|uniref:Uncharacterized protein n=1 Tax=Caerostris extrusa TaxID=172846 RepID=A0AAV4XD98_CAEEX|nr:hypothetical protein CEXT_187071 [Caerostris extrusa]